MRPTPEPPNPPVRDFAPGNSPSGPGRSARPGGGDPQAAPPQSQKLVAVHILKTKTEATPELKQRLLPRSGTKGAQGPRNLHPSRFQTANDLASALP